MRTVDAAVPLSSSGPAHMHLIIVWPAQVLTTHLRRFGNQFSDGFATSQGLESDDCRVIWHASKQVHGGGELSLLSSTSACRPTSEADTVAEPGSEAIGADVTSESAWLGQFD